MARLDEFKSFREKMNKRILKTGNMETKRFFSLDGAVYKDGALDGKTKELMGLVASTVLRCDDCIAYHIIQCKTTGSNRDEIMEALNIALVVGGSIVIPHYRRAVELLDELEEE
ncbi:carboxymuconolactone decarboxylase family protein [Mesotoga sp. BH458_6_3_2_1]|uniref:carboxymuconolactone decarboxylase family protein n=1 Tax=Mesotoga sp. BH458_6_3_2_1 TaxID=1437446 RepID=UPI000EF25208|nr:carboxymuconolactone decarboxylase family protein [Mesotoga sp. BH458_6_3_2_1]RLL86587.1 alkylhydroperoxidase [Mesotoga sp. BH458_6_3_2_1]